MFKALLIAPAFLLIAASAQAGLSQVRCTGASQGAKYEITLCVDAKEHKEENEESELPVVACKGAKEPQVVVKKTAKGKATQRTYGTMSQFNKLYEDGFEIFTYLEHIDDFPGPFLLSIKADYDTAEVGIQHGRNEFVELKSAVCTLK